MKFIRIPLQGAYLIEPEKKGDERGFFSRAWCRKEFEKHGLKGEMVQCNIAFNHARGTVREMHYQVPPYAECRLLQCTKGAIYDVIVDIRKDSPTHKKWLGVEELRQVFECIGLAYEQFQGRRFIRLNQLRYLLNSGKLDETLRWT